jgi:hypothetical protein
MIIRHQILSRYADQHRQMTPAGRFWIGYVVAVVLIALWVLV